jgi:hypothetical protein
MLPGELAFWLPPHSNIVTYSGSVAARAMLQVGKKRSQREELRVRFLVSNVLLLLVALARGRPGLCVCGGGVDVMVAVM